ncbi:unnamed protein product [Schistosoma turkestanicum]|nr:unnamed protein product [Schistosoma turkestanicum]
MPMQRNLRKSVLNKSEETKRQSISSDSKFSVDEILNKYVGENGIWQWSIVFLIVLNSPLMVTLPVFVNAVPYHRCRMENSMEKLFKDQNLSFEEAATFVGPWKGEVPETRMGCLQFALDWSNITLIRNLLLNKSEASLIDRESLHTEKCIYGYVYKSKEFQYPSTVVEEFNLVCDNSMLSPLGTSLFIVGMTFGFILGGYIGDKFGRRPSAIAFSLIEMLAAIGVSLAPNHYVYDLMRTIVGFSSTGKAIVLRVLPIELTNAKYRSYFTSFIVLGVVFGHRALMTGIAYLIQEWRILNALSMLPCFTCFMYFCLLPESPRWLLSQYRVEEAIMVLKKGCRINHIFKKDKSKLSQFDNYLKDINITEFIVEKRSIHRESMSFSERFINLLQSTKKSLCNRQINKTLILCILVFMYHSLAYLGITLFSKYINYNIYIVTLINALTGIPGPIIASVAYRCFKYRRFPLICTYIISGILLCIGGVYTLLWKPLTDTVLNICCNGALIMYSASTIMLSVYSAELFPSYMRTGAVGISNGLGRIGGIISTFVNYTDLTFGHGTPVLIYAGSAIFQAFLLYCLHDTSGEDLPDVEVGSKSTTDNSVHRCTSKKSIDTLKEECVIDRKTSEDQMKSSSTAVTKL